MERLVWDPFRGRTHPVRHGTPGKTLSDAFGRVATDFFSGDPVRSTKVRTAYPKTAEQLANAGWTTDRTVFRAVPREPHLKRVQIESTLRCNLRCQYCYSTCGPARRGGLDPATVTGIIEEADDLGVIAMDFTGGEFILDPAWAAHVALARSRGMAVTVHTNGTLLTRAAAEFLSTQHVGAVQISLDSHLPELHDASRRGRDALRRTLAGLDLLAEYGVPTRVSVMAHRGNVRSLPETLAFIKQRYPRAVINVDRVVTTGTASTDAYLSAAEFWNLVHPYLAGGVRSGQICDSTGSADHEPACGVAYSYVYITAAGEIAACPTMTSREHERFRGPRYRPGGLAAAWYDSPFFRSFRRTNCAHAGQCRSASVCGGGCRSNAYAETGDVTAPDVVACNTHNNGGPVFVDFAEKSAQGDYATVL